eukprot:TCONS_00002331-protein
MASNNLFKWQKYTNPIDAARGTSKDSMSGWIKKIQAASEEAAKEAFGGDIFDNSLENMELMPDDESVYEAQQLLDGWLKEKSFSQTQNEMEFQHETWNRQRKPTKSMKTDRSHFENILHEAEIQDEATARYGLDIDDIDEDLAVSEVLVGMMNKNIATGIDLGLNGSSKKKSRDPVPKMNIRHNEVKERSKARKIKGQAKETEREIKRRARERIHEEEKERQIRSELEEKAIQDEMNRIREELEREKQKKEDEIRRKERIFEEAKQQMQRELQKRKEEENAQRRMKEFEMRRRQERKDKQLQKQTIFKMKMDMQILHKHFAAWYNLVLENRVSMGKARAVADWKCKLRAWNAWRAYVVAVKYNEEAKQIEQKVKENFRKEQMAVNFWNKKLMKVCLYSWLKYTRHKMEKKMLKLEHEQKAKKMEKFITSAAAMLQQNRQLDKDEQEQHEEEIQKGEEMTRDNRTHKQKSTPRKNEIRLGMVLPERNQNKNEQIITSKTGQQELKSRPFDSSKRRTPRQRVEQELMKLQQEFDDEDDENENDLEHQRHLKYNNRRRTTTKNDQNSQNQRKRTGSLTNHQIDEQISLTDRSDLYSGHTTDNRLNDGQNKKSIVTPRVRSDKPATKPLHLAMEERDRQRKERRALIEAEKRRKEEEKLKVLREQQAERERLEEEVKQEKIRKRRDEKLAHMEKEKEKQKQQELHRLKLETSTQHYHHNLLTKYGLQPLKLLVQQMKNNTELSDQHYNNVLTSKMFHCWLEYTGETMERKKQLADQKYGEILLKRSFRSWKKCRFHLQNLNKMARMFSIRRMVKKTFCAWQSYVVDERILMWAKENDAEEHSLVRMKKKYFNQWKDFVNNEKEERIREKRRQELRKKVQNWLPDFNAGKT